MGGGSSINIWRDNWLSRSTGLKISAKRHNTRLRWVSDLFLSGRKVWDENLIKYLFYPHDTEEILKIRIHAYGDGDFIAWHYEKNSIFSVKSAYNLAIKLKDSQDKLGQSSGDPCGERRLWNLIWKANIPQKIRIFAWRAATNSLAVQTNRVKHHQITSGMCSICGVEDENTFHALITCSKARALRLALRES